MENIDFINEYLSKSINIKKTLLGNNEELKKISDVADHLVSIFNSNGKVMIAGNGGSAADSQHIAAEFVSRFYFDRPGIPAIALTTDTSMLTAIGNDYGFENLFSRQVQAQGKKGDMFIGISTSGNSKNILNATKTAKDLGILTVSLCGNTGKLKEVSDISIEVPSASTPFIQECHICIGHIICAIVEEKLFKEYKN